MKGNDFKQFGLPIQFSWGIIGLISVLMISYFEYQKETSFSDTLKLCVLSLILVSIIIFYIQSQDMPITDMPYFNIILIGTYLVSLFLILVTMGKVEFHLWLLGGLAIAMLLDVYLGYLVTYNLIFFASLIGELGIESIVYLLILGSLLCMLSNYMKKLSTVGYATIIILSMQIVLLFIMNNFIIQDAMNVDAVYSVFSSLLVIGISFGVFCLYRKCCFPRFKEIDIFSLISDDSYEENSQSYVEPQEEPQEESQEESQEETQEKPQKETQEEPIGIHSLEEVLNVDFVLLQRLKQHSIKLYNHSLLISELSGRAAKEVDANEQKARAGGLYHEIGRIEGKNYVEEGIKLVEAYHLPSMIADIIRQHNLKYEIPNTPEAAIVMMTVSIIATKEYLEKTVIDKTGNSEGRVTVPIEKIVDNVFQMRLTKGSLDDSGLTLQQFNKLKDFYLHM